ncbi:MAG: hypothetical protein WCT14_03285 [Treponemataceae bacterium]
MKNLLGQPCIRADGDRIDLLDDGDARPRSLPHQSDHKEKQARYLLIANPLDFSQGNPPTPRPIRLFLSRRRAANGI